eukprot:1296311-Pyramimonas_sp.AAC.1
MMQAILIDIIRRPCHLIAYERLPSQTEKLSNKAQATAKHDSKEAKQRSTKGQKEVKQRSTKGQQEVKKRSTKEFDAETQLKHMQTHVRTMSGKGLTKAWQRSGNGLAMRLRAQS